MPARIAKTYQDGINHCRQYPHTANHDEPVKTPKIKRGVRGAIPSRKQVLESVDWRLSGIPIDELELLTQALRPFFNDLTTERPEVLAILKSDLIDTRRDRRGPFSLAAAISARDAEACGDALRFGLAGAVVVQAYSMAMRRVRALPDADALDDLILDSINKPLASGCSLFDFFANDLPGPALVEFDEGKDELVCQLDIAKDDLTNVGRKEFSERARRAAKRRVA
jgi:hypothetical protein